MEQAMETVKVEPRPRRQRSITRQALDLSIKALISQGFSVRQTAATLKISTATVQAARKSMKDAGQDPQAYVSASRNEMLGKLTDHIFDKGLKMKKFRGSDVTTVMKDYSSRAFPTRQEGGGDNYSFVQINMNAALPTTTGCALGDGKTVEAEILNENRDDNIL